MKVTTKVGAISVTADTVTIARRAFMGQGGEQRNVKVADLNGIDFQQATVFSPGHLRLLHAGSRATTLKLRYYDADVIMFDLGEQSAMLPVRDYLMALITGSPFKTDDIRSQTTIGSVFQAVIAVVVLITVGYWAFS